ncbi:MAG: hypothetical protein RLN69_05080 [Woeseiaceae bacterium]
MVPEALGDKIIHPYGGFLLQDGMSLTEVDAVGWFVVKRRLLRITAMFIR